MREPFSGAVLMGGASRRMGRDKAFLDVGGVPMAAVAVAALADAGTTEVLAVGGDGARLRQAAPVVTPVADGWPGAGPLGGIVTAFAAARLDVDVVVILACDLPGVVAETVTVLVDAVAGRDAAVPVVDGHPEVVLAAYRRSGCAARFEAALGAGERAPRRVLDGLDVGWVELADPTWARNVNRPDDLP